jgi:4-amino-4-deoxy-L-arabinose transferase-like glycosyltransferase
VQSGYHREPHEVSAAEENLTNSRSLLVVVLAAAFLATLAARPLYKTDEARYGEISREMAQSGDWVTPRLNGIKYFEKPPLQYWAGAAAIELFGVHDWAARLWTGLMALAGVALAFFGGKRLFGAPAGVAAAAILAGVPLYLAFGQLNTLDMGVSVFLSAAVFGFVFAQGPDAERTRRRWMLAGWAACGLAVLSKGLIGIVLPAAAVALYVIVRRDWALLRRLEIVRGTALFLVIAAPWFVAVSLRNPEFAHFFFVQEHFQRFTTTMHHRVHPAWFFIPVLAVGVAPFLFVIAAGWWAALRRPGPGFSPTLFLALWALVVFVFFSASSSKLPGYILPLLPALAVLGGAYVARAAPRRMLVAQSAVIAFIGLALAAAAPRLARVGADRLDSFAGAYSAALIAAGLVLAAAGVYAAVLAGRGKLPASMIALSVGAFCAVLAAIAGHRVYAPLFNAESTIAAMNPRPAQETPIFTVHSYDHSVPWSLRRTVTMVGYRDEFGEAVHWEPGRYIPDDAGFVRAWTEARDAYALFAVRDFDTLRAGLGVPMEVVARGPRYIIVRKP